MKKNKNVPTFNMDNFNFNSYHDMLDNLIPILNSLTDVSKETYLELLLKVKKRGNIIHRKEKKTSDLKLKIKDIYILGYEKNKFVAPDYRSTWKVKLESIELFSLKSGIITYHNISKLEGYGGMGNFTRCYLFKYTNYFHFIIEYAESLLK